MKRLLGNRRAKRTHRAMTQRTRARAHRARSRLRFECLEDRRLLAVIWQDNFEGAGPNLGGGDRDAPNHADKDHGTIFASGDYFVRTSDPGDGSTNGFTQTVTNIQGSAYWRAEDLDGSLGTNPDVINWTGIDLTGVTSRTFSGFFGARTSGPFEADDFLRVEADTGGGFTTLIEFRSDLSGGSTGHLREDTNASGVGDGGLLTGALQQFPVSGTIGLPASGDTLALRLTASLNGGSEEAFWDHFTVGGTPAAVPEINLSGNGVGIADDPGHVPSLSDDTDFGGVQIGGNNSHTFVITNTGGAALNLTDGPPRVTIGGTHASDFQLTSDASSPVASGGTSAFMVTFVPQGVGVRTASVSIGNNDADESPYNFNLQGVGLPAAPEIDVSGLGVSIAAGDISPETADNTDFGQVAVASGTQTNTFKITNLGFAPLNLTGTPLIEITGPHASEFSVTSLPVAPVAIGGGTASFQITFNPVATGLRTATVRIANDDSDENPYQYVIQGTGRGVVFWKDDFESAGPSVGGGDRDAPNHPADRDNGEICAEGDYFVRTNDPGDGTTNGFTQTFTNIGDSFYWRVEDTDACPAGAGADPDYLEWTGIPYAGVTGGLFVGWFAARPEGSDAHENGDLVTVQASVDGGVFAPILQFAHDGDGELARDSDFDGVGEGPELTEVLTRQIAHIPAAGAVLALRVVYTDMDGSEEIAIDNFQLERAPEATVSNQHINGPGNVNRSGIASLALGFDQNVVVAGAGSLEVWNHTSGAVVDISNVQLQGQGGDVLTWILTGSPFPDGIYTATLRRSATTPALAGTYVFQFHVLAGDSDGDAAVGFSDFSDLATNFNSTNGRPFGPGDMDGDGDVNFGDFGILAGSFNRNLSLLATDFGDAPETGTGFPTTAANDGARHIIDVGLFLGGSVDAEADGQPNAGATGDGGDEDGVSFGALQAGSAASIAVTASVSTAGLLNAWIDFNRDGDWDDAHEQVFVDEILNNGITNLSVPIPAGAVPGQTLARFRLSEIEGYSYYGLARKGEVEDYSVTILAARGSLWAGRLLGRDGMRSAEPDPRQKGERPAAAVVDSFWHGFQPVVQDAATVSSANSLVERKLVAGTAVSLDLNSRLVDRLWAEEELF